MTERLRVGVIGLGPMGGHHARNYYLLPETQLEAIADPKRSTAEKAKEYGAAHYSDYKEMLDGCELDAVSVAVPTDMHYQVAMDTLGHGISTLVEKPIATSVTEGQAMIDLAEEKGLVFSVGHIERYNQVIERTKQLIDNGELGTILSVQATRVGGFPAIEPKTDVITDLAIHDIDIFNYLLGKGGKVRGVGGQRTQHSSEFDSAEIMLDYDGVTGIIVANWVTPVKVRELTITGTMGYLTANYINQQITMYERTNIVTRGSFDDFVEAYGEPTVHVIKPPEREPMRRQLGVFALAVRTNNPEGLIDPKEALSALDIALAAADRLRSQNGRRINAGEQDVN